MPPLNLDFGAGFEDQQESTDYTLEEVLELIE